jgi:tRNA(Ile2) C34 agmatinyltransferase TiaS
MSSQTTGGYRCEACGMTFNSIDEIDKHNREEHKTTTL